MTKFSTFLRKTVAAFAMAGFAMSQGHALPLVAPEVPAAGAGVIAVSGDCYAIGVQQATQAGGQLGNATVETRNGQQVCVVIVLMPARDGNRPVRSTIVVPMG